MAKSSKSAKSDRQKVIDDIRRKQKSAEKRQGMWIVGICVIVALGIIALAGWKPMTEGIRKATLAGKSIDEIGAPADSCKPVITRKSEGEQVHVPATEQVTYPDAPPAYGSHWNEAGLAPAPISQRFYTASDRPELESLVHNLEHGFTVLWYDETTADSGGQIAQIQKISDLLDVSDTNGRMKFKAVPWTDKDSAEVTKGLKAAVTTAEKGVIDAEAALKKAKKADKKAARAAVKKARAAVAEAKKQADGSGSFPEGQHVAITHWTAEGTGIWQYCSKVSGAALQDFMYKYPYSDSPEPDVF